MKRVMLVALAILLVGASAFAVDFSASVYMTGDIWGNDHGFQLANQGQQDADLLQFSVSTDNAGASVAFWSPQNTAGVDGGILNMRYEKLWFKPIAQVKFNLGHIGSGLYTEQLNWWMVPTAGAAVGWSSDAGVNGKGLSLDITPMDGLAINVGLATGQYGNKFMAWDGADRLVITSDTHFGATAKYNVTGFGSIGAGYRFNGGSEAVAPATTITLNDSEARIGFDVNAVPGLYAFVTGIARFENFTAPSATTAAYGLAGITIDNYFAYSAGAFTVKGEIPVTIRTTGITAEHNYLTYDIKASYKVVDNCSPFLRISQNGGLGSVSGGAIDFSSVQFAPTVKLGADYSIGKASFATWLQVNVPAANSGVTTMSWAIPFQVRVSW